MKRRRRWYRVTSYRAVTFHVRATDEDDAMDRHLEGESEEIDENNLRHAGGADHGARGAR